MASSAPFTPRRFEAADLKSGAVEPHYKKVLVRLLAAHALAEKLTAEGYQRVLQGVANPELLAIAEKNLAEEHQHAAMVYGLLGEIGVSEQAAERSLIGLARAPSFQAPRYFAEQAWGELDLLMGSVSLDMTGLIMIGVNYRDSSYAPHARVAELILDDEAGHDETGARTLSAAVQRLGPEAVNEGLRRWLPWAVNFFGPPGTGFTFDCIRFGLKRKDNQELAGLFLSMLERRLAHAGLALPQLSDSYPHTLA